MTRFLAVCAVVVSGVLAASAPARASWAQENTPNPPGATVWSLSAISCPTASGCEAVGGYTDGTGQHLLAEAKSGASWTIQSIPSPAGGSGAQLDAVSCRSVSACVAVGSYNNATNTVTLAETWNGGSWTVETPANPSGATTTTLNGISCTSAAACIAVGSSYNGTNTITLAESWNGHSWTIQSTPNPAGATSSQLGGISCTSANACVAVG